MRNLLVVGTRPELIKTHIIAKKLDCPILMSGQHYSDVMNSLIFSDLGIEPYKNLDLKTSDFGLTIKPLMDEIQDMNPDRVIVQGDTNTVLAACIAAKAFQKEVIHIEAGLRCSGNGDLSMPEERNRVFVDHHSDILFAPTEIAKQNMITEGIDSHKIHVVGNTVADSLIQMRDLAGKRYAHKPFDFDILLTIHRDFNMAKIEKILHSVNELAKHNSLNAIFPVHPRTMKYLHMTLTELNKKYKEIEFTDALPYLEFLRLESCARSIITDSGGVQEEACILGTPCFVMRDSTERPETVQIGASVLVTPDNLHNHFDNFDMLHTWESPYGDGRTSDKIVRILNE